VSLLDSVVVPVAESADAAATADALAPLEPGEVVVVYVVEKTGGAPDQANVDQREMEAEEAFDAFRDRFPEAESEVRYGTDVVEQVFAAADERGATAVAFRPRTGSRLVRLISGDYALTLVTENDLPVVSLPNPDA
jgi:hypothetical protein